jgi:hypothetical protein
LCALVPKSRNGMPIAQFVFSPSDDRSSLRRNLQRFALNLHRYEA